MPCFRFGSMNALVLPAIEAKLNDLCSAIAANPEVLSARERAEAFLADENAVGLYREVIMMGRSLEQRERENSEITNSEVRSYEELQGKADAHDGIREFSEAQQVLQGVANLVNGFVSKTLEKGRVPTTEEVFGGGGCGEGCGCH